MKLRSLLPALALALCGLGAAQAHAQVGVYLNPVYANVHIGTADSGPYAFLGSNTTDRSFGGVDLGLQWDFFPIRNGYKLGLDMRQAYLNGNNAHLDTFSGAVRLVAPPTAHKLVPYAEFGVGAGRSKAEESILTTTKAQLDLRAGIDWPISHRVDFRVVELGYSRVTTMSSQIERANTTIPAAQIIDLSSGLVFRFGKTR